MSGSCTRLRGLRALISSCGNWRASCHATGSTSTRTRCLASSSGAGEREEGTTVGEKVDALIRRVDERWRFVEDPEDMRGVMQALRHCHVMQRVGPKNLMLRFVLAEDDVGESWVVPDASTAYPGRGTYVLPDQRTLFQAAKQGAFQFGFKQGSMRLPFGFEGIIEKELTRDAQKLFYKACLSATSAKTIDIPATNDDIDATFAEQDFTSMLDAAVEASLEKHTKRVREIDTNDNSTTSWILKPRDADRAREHDDLNDTRDIWCGTSSDIEPYARILHILSDGEILAALRKNEGNDNITSENYENVKNTLLRDTGHANVDGNLQRNACVVLQNVSNKVSYRLHHAQLRLHLFRQSILEGGPLIDFKLKKKKKRSD